MNNCSQLMNDSGTGQACTLLLGKLKVADALFKLMRFIHQLHHAAFKVENLLAWRASGDVSRVCCSCSLRALRFLVF